MKMFKKWRNSPALSNAIADLLLFLPDELNNSNLEYSTKTIIELVTVCVKIVFTFNELYYRQAFGFAIKNPCSVL